MIRLPVIGIVACAGIFSAVAERVVLLRTGFDEFHLDASSGWTAFDASRAPEVRTVRLPNGNAILRGVRSPASGWVAFSKNFSEPQKRIAIEFDFAFSKGMGRSMNLWSHDPDGRDASQFNLCVQGGALRQYDGASRTWEVITTGIQPSPDDRMPIWHRLRAVIDSQSDAIDYWISAPGSRELSEKPTATMRTYRTQLPIAGIDFVSGTRIAKEAWYFIDNLIITGGPEIPAPHPLPKPATFELWSGGKIAAPKNLPFVHGVEHSTIQRATADGYKFLHGAAIIHHKGTLFANWANSPVDENSAGETLQGRRSKDDGRTWSELEMIAPGFATKGRHSHGVLMSHQETLWAFCCRFGIGTPGRKFPGLQAEAFVLNEATDRWESRGIVMTNCWPYDEPVRMKNGNYITGGQDKDGYPVVAISDGDNLLKWNSVLIPFPAALQPSFAETTVMDVGKQIMAVIRGGRGVAWVSSSKDFGATWREALPSNLPMPRAKAYLGKLSTGQLFLVSNLRNRDTLIISVSEPDGTSLKEMWRIRHGRSEAPRFKGSAKGPQWSYPYAHEHAGKLYVVYSIGKEDCGLSVLPVESLSIRK
mgnify:CR=1 FL=1